MPVMPVRFLRDKIDKHKSAVPASVAVPGSPPPPPVPAQPARISAPPPYSEESPQAGYTSANYSFCAAAEHAMDAVARAVGGHDSLDAKIHTCIPALYLFVTESPIKDLALTNRPSKFIILLGTLAVLQLILAPAILDTAATSLWLAFTWHASERVRRTPAPMLLANLVSPILRVLPSCFALLAGFTLLAVPNGRPGPSGTTLVETYVNPHIKPLAARVRGLLNTGNAREHLQHMRNTDPIALAKGATAAIFLAWVGYKCRCLTCSSSLVLSPLGALAWRLTWLLLALRTILVLDALRVNSPRAVSRAHGALGAWSARMAMHALENHLPLLGIGSRMPLAHAVAAVGMVAVIFWDDILELRGCPRKVDPQLLRFDIDANAVISQNELLQDLSAMVPGNHLDVLRGGVL